jgi:hypothetical protein
MPCGFEIFVLAVLQICRAYGAGHMNEPCPKEARRPVLGKPNYRILTPRFLPPDAANETTGF